VVREGFFESAANNGEVHCSKFRQVLNNNTLQKKIISKVLTLMWVSINVGNSRDDCSAS
jgi:hypothetical protein